MVPLTDRSARLSVFSDELTHCQAASIEQGTTGICPMFAARTERRNLRRPSKLAQDNHQHIVSQAAFLKVVDECRDAHVKDRHQAFEGEEDVSVGTAVVIPFGRM